MAGAKGDGRQARWDRHNQARRQHILDAALAVLEDAGPGAEVHVQAIADRAGLGRTVVYRHFADRADLDSAVQAHILTLLRAEMEPSLSFVGTPVQIVHRIVGTYVGWAVAHPALHEFGQQDQPGPGPGPLQLEIEQVSSQINALFTVGLEVLGLDLGEDDAVALDPLVFGLVGAVFTATRRWLSRPERKPSREVFVDLVSESVWLQIAGMAAQRGLVVDPDLPVELLLDGAPDADGVTPVPTVTSVAAVAEARR